AHISVILETLDSAPAGLSIPELEKQVNLRHSQIEKTLKFLSVEDPSPVTKQGSKWFTTAVAYKVDQERLDHLTTLRHAEQQDMLSYMKTNVCLMQYLAGKLDDPFAQPCGKCANCSGAPFLPATIRPELANEAALFLKRSHQLIRPRRQWPSGNPFPLYDFRGRISADLQAAEGRALSIWGDAGWGESVKRGKYKDARFADELVEGCAEMIQRWAPNPAPRWITCVPSLRHPGLVPDFARRLGYRMGMDFRPCLRKIHENPPQKKMENSFQQAHNLDGVFEIDQALLLEKPVLLIDDMTDSGWTFTVIAALLRKAGCSCVYPLALAVTSPRLD
ncbi:MAG: ATP-dependent DNA helicase RecG, partial [Desulfobacterales bacterium]|nr:ATP-dependent DNA helicase RecG [Desulfobacterales bacterium]